MELLSQWGSFHLTIRRSIPCNITIWNINIIISEPYPPWVIWAAFTRTFCIVIKIIKITHHVSETYLFWNIVCCFQYFYDDGKSSCKCCWNYSCTTIVINLYVALTPNMLKNFRFILRDTHDICAIEVYTLLQ